MEKQHGYTLVEIIFAIVALFGLVGWCLNIADIVNADFSNITGLLVLRVIGVFVAPLGAVLGYF